MPSLEESFGFGYRVGGVIIKEEGILLQSDEHIDFWVLPGGGVKPFEASEKTLTREFKEELGLEVAVERLLFVIENSFEFMGKKHHGIELMFLVNPLDPEKKLEQTELTGIEKEYYPEIYGELKIIFKWFKLSELDSITIMPKVLNEELKNIPDHPKLLKNLEVKK